MPIPPRLFPGDVELGKRDDDHMPGSKSGLAIAWHHRRMPHRPHRRTLKRALWGILALVGLFYFFKNMPTDLENPRPRPSYGPAKTNNPSSNPPDSPGSGPKPGQKATAEVPQHDFSGPIKFYRLASTLHAVSRTSGSDSANNNVVGITHFHSDSC